MDEEAKQRLGEWLCGRLNPPGWPVLRVEMRAMMLDLYRQGKYDELMKCVQATIEEHRQHTQYLADLERAKELAEERERFGPGAPKEKPTQNEDGSWNIPVRKAYRPDWVDTMPNHPVTVMLRNIVAHGQVEFWGNLEYYDDPRQHIFN